jgi:putative oxidoreductase
LITSPTRSTTDSAPQDVGLLVVRLTVGLVLAGHGAQKLFGWFDGPGLEATSAGFARMGYDPGKLFAALAGASELVGGLLLALGLLTPLATAAIVGVMFNAVAAVHWEKGVWAANGGFEYPLLIGMVGTAIALTGPGRLALDRGRPWARGGLGVGAFSLALGLGAGLLTLVVKAI